MVKRAHTLLIIRHAHRDLSHPRLDNGLSAKGKEQARRIQLLYRAVFGKRIKPVLLSSPKRRCVETLKPIAQYTGAPIENDGRLLEQGGQENASRFHARVGKFMASLKGDQRPLVVVCSHGDWIPVALRSATGGRMRLKKGGWATVEFEEGEEPRLSWLLQKLD